MASPSRYLPPCQKLYAVQQVSRPGSPAWYEAREELQARTSPTPAVFRRRHERRPSALDTSSRAFKGLESMVAALPKNPPVVLGAEDLDLLEKFNMDGKTMLNVDNDVILTPKEVFEECYMMTRAILLIKAAGIPQEAPRTGWTAKLSAKFKEFKDGVTQRASRDD